MGYQYYSSGPEGKAYIMLSVEEAEKPREKKDWMLQLRRVVGVRD